MCSNVDDVPATAGDTKSAAPDPVTPQSAAKGPFVAGVDRNLARQLIRLAARLELAAGEIVFKRGEIGTAFFLIARGCVRIEGPGERGDRMIAELGPGEYFGEMALLTGEPRSATAVAATAVELHVVTRAAFWDLLTSAPTMALEITRHLSRRLRARTLLAPPAPTRVLLLLATREAHDEPVFCEQFARAVAATTYRHVTLVDTVDRKNLDSLTPTGTDTTGVSHLVYSGHDIDALKDRSELLIVRAHAGSQVAAVWLAAADAVVFLDFVDARCPAMTKPWDRCRALLCEVRPDAPGPLCDTPSGPMPVMRLQCRAAQIDPIAMRRLVRRVLQRRIGVVLSAGGAKGLAHLGAVSVLEQAGIEIDVIAGTSMGGIVGGLLAMGHNATDLLQRFEGLARNFRHLLIDLGIPRVSLLRGDKKRLLIEQHTGGRNIDDLPVTFATVAADLVSGREAVFLKGSLAEALDATSAIPMIFPPVHIGKRAYVDGWVVNPLPVDVARRLGADIVIAVDTCTQDGAQPDYFEAPSTATARFRIWRANPAIASIAIRALEVGARERSVSALAVSDVGICPVVGNFSPIDFRPLAAIVECGRQAAAEALPAVRAAVEGNVLLDR